MWKIYLDAMMLVQRFVKLDIFLTMACNHNWIEIQRELIPMEDAQNKSDLISRIFKAKLKELKKVLFKKEIFGPIAVYVYVIEFRKNYLLAPHICASFPECTLLFNFDMFAP